MFKYMIICKKEATLNELLALSRVTAEKRWPSLLGPMLQRQWGQIELVSAGFYIWTHLLILTFEPLVEMTSTPLANR
jgi:hypothetical protein